MLIYADLLFFTNFLIDWMLLFFTDRILRNGTKGYLLCLSACFGAIFSIVYLYFQIDGWLGNLCKVFITGCMLFICFHKSLKRFLKAVIVYLSLSLILAGFLILTAFDRYLIYQNMLILPYSYFALIFALSIVCFFLIRFIRQTIFQHKQAVLEVPVQLTLNHVRQNLTGYLDTGNQAYEPISGLPVVFLSKSAQKQFFQDAFVNNSPYILPYQTISGKNLITGIQPESFYVGGREVPCIVGLCDNTFHKNYDLLLHASFMNLEEESYAEETKTVYHQTFLERIARFLYRRQSNTSAAFDEGRGERVHFTYRKCRRQKKAD